MRDYYAPPTARSGRAQGSEHPLAAACLQSLEGDACYALARLYMTGGAGVERDPEEGAALLRVACKLGYAQACQTEAP